MITELLLPDLGEDITSGTVITVAVAANDTITAGQTLFEIETDKVTVEIPAESNGVIRQLYAQPGDEVAVGDRLAAIESAGGDIPLTAATSSAKETPATTAVIQETAATPRQAEAALPRHDRPARKPTATAHSAPAGPAARRMARELGLAIHTVPGSGARGRICKQDVIAFAKRQLQEGSAGSKKPEPTPLPDLSRFGTLESTPLSNIQRATARNMARAWQEIPHAWMQEEIDITALEQLRQELKSARGDQSPPLTITPFIIKAMADAMAQHPLFNATIDLTNDQILYRRYSDIGVAVDTPRGLVVPVIRGVEKLSPEAIAREIAKLSVRADQNSLKPNELQGAGITLSNLGNMGLSSIYPIINWPQSSIVGVASAGWRQRRDPDGSWRERLLLPLTLAFDHRLINGADAARFVAQLKNILEKP
ncbi:MAG: dihydrolipoamide acetyltransferase family protein [Sedimenticola sp.]